MTGLGLGVVDELEPTPFQLKILRQKASGKIDNAAAVGPWCRRAYDSPPDREPRRLAGVSNRAALFVEVGRRGWLDLGVDDDPTNEIEVEPSADERTDSPPEAVYVGLPDARTLLGS